MATFVKIGLVIANDRMSALHSTDHTITIHFLTFNGGVYVYFLHSREVCGNICKNWTHDLVL